MTDDGGGDDDDDHERYDLGVLFVHGIGQQARGQTLTAWADPVIRWLQVWLGRDPVEVGAAWPRRQPDANKLDVGAERGWLDLYASHDPVANGALFHLSSMPGKQLLLTSRRVVNFASPLRDHTGRAAGGQRRPLGGDRPPGRRPGHQPGRPAAAGRLELGRVGAAPGQPGGGHAGHRPRRPGRLPAAGRAVALVGRARVRLDAAPPGRPALDRRVRLAAHRQRWLLLLLERFRLTRHVDRERSVAPALVPAGAAGLIVLLVDPAEIPLGVTIGLVVAIFCLPLLAATLPPLLSASAAMCRLEGRLRAWAHAEPAPVEEAPAAPPTEGPAGAVLEPGGSA